MNVGRALKFEMCVELARRGCKRGGECQVTVTFFLSTTGSPFLEWRYSFLLTTVLRYSVQNAPV